MTAPVCVSTASVVVSASAAGAAPVPVLPFFFFLDAFLGWEAAAIMSPSTAAGSTASSRSRSQISMAGSIVPMATKLPRALASEALGGQSIHAKARGNAGGTKRSE